jgi:transcriptional regulator with XRE-family HTH domain
VEKTVKNGESAGTPVARFAAELRAWRQRYGWSQAEVADKLGYSGSHVSSVETQTRLPVADFAQRCDEIFSTPVRSHGYRKTSPKRPLPPWFSAFVNFEAKATRIHCWDNRCLTGLIQSEDYARSIIRAGNLDASDDEVARDVAALLPPARTTADHATGATALLPVSTFKVYPKYC